MQYTNLGNTGLVVSRFSFGAMTFGQGPLVGDLINAIDQKMADQMVNMALDAESTSLIPPTCTPTVSLKQCWAKR